MQISLIWQSDSILDASRGVVRMDAATHRNMPIWSSPEIQASHQYSKTRRLRGSICRISLRAGFLVRPDVGRSINGVPKTQ